MQEALEALKQASESYLDAKKEQRRPFPSALRQTRLALAESIIDFAERSVEQLSLGGLEKAVDIPEANKPEMKVQEVKERENLELNMPRI